MAYLRSLRQFHQDYFHGVLAALVIAIAAVFLARHYGAPAMLFALLLGIAFNFLSEHERCIQGIDLTAKRILRVGVALLGLRISFEAVSDLGTGPILLVLGGVLSTIAVGLLLARLFGKPLSFGCLTGGAVAICGASAAMALSSVLPQTKDNERDTIFTVITVTAFSTTAMVLYPVIANLFGLDDPTTGIFLGATIHDVAQVVGAGYGVSDQAGDVSTIVKLLRVAMLLPVVLCVLVIVRHHMKSSGHQNVKLPFPWFVVGFVVLVTLNSSYDIPLALKSGLIDLSKWCIIMSVAALGMKTSFKALVKVGFLPVALIFAETAYLAVLALIALYFM